MKKKSTKKLFLVQIVFIIHFIICSLLNAKEPSVNAEISDFKNYYIRWIDQFSSYRDFKDATSIPTRIYRIVFGVNKQSLVRPVNILTEDTTSFWILDQGSRLPAFINKKAKKIKFIKQKNITQFPSLVGICKVWKDEIVITDSKLNTIFLWNSYSNKLQNFNDKLKLNQPTGIAYSTITNQVWVAETASHRLVILDHNGEVVKYIGTRGTNPGQFNFPTFIWIDSLGTIYVVDSMNFRIQILDKEGAVKSIFGEQGDATGYFACPKGIATDSYGHIYVVDALFHTVQIFDNKGNYLYNFGKQGRGNGEFWLPSGIYIDQDNYIYIADSYNARIQIFKLMKGDMNEN